jgi:photosystem II stability/assembly factor-like uncharacterized protein
MMKKIMFIVLVFPFMLNLTAQQVFKNYRLDKFSTSTSSTTDPFPSSNSIERILIQDNVIWLATDKGLAKSTDNGNTWINYYKSNDFGEESISTIAYNNGVIWAGLWHNEVSNGSNVPVGTGLRYSTDQGLTWTNIPQPVDNPGDSSIVYGINKIRALPVTVAEENFTYGIALTKNTVWIVTFSGGLRKSTDMGKTWQRIVLPPDYLDSIKPSDTLKFSLQPVAGKFGPEGYLNHRAFSILAVNDSTLYVGTAGGINLSTDGGVSWKKFNHTNEANPISGNFILSIKKNDYDNSIWAATWQADGATEFNGVSTSTDNGLTWKNYLSGEQIKDFAFKYHGNSGNYSSADVFAAAGDGVFRSSNNGSSWISAPEIRDNNSGIFLTTKDFLSIAVNGRSNGTTDIWLGSANGLASLNEFTGFWTGTWKVYLTSQKLQSTSETYAFPNPFNPGQQIIRIKYSTTQQTNVTIRIFDFGMNLLRTLVENNSRPVSDQNMEVWDGRDQHGKIVPNGVYFYRIDLGYGSPLFGKIMVIM